MLGCGCTDSSVWAHGHRSDCRWRGAAALDYPGVREWQRHMRSADPDPVIRQARRENAPLDAVYPSGRGLWRTVAEAERPIPDIPQQRMLEEQLNVH